MTAETRQGVVDTDLVAYRWLGLLNEMDARGRPLSEGSAPAQMHAASRMEYVACPYADTRAQANKPMNRSALVAMTSCWEDICNWSRAVGAAYRKRYPVAQATFLDVWRVAAVLRTAPFFILLARSPDAAPSIDRIPEWVAGAYKAARGVEDAILHMACVGIVIERRPYDFDALYGFACRHRLFEGATEVCAGPPTLIKVFVEQLASASEQPHRMLHPLAADHVMHRLLDYAACETLVESLSTMYEVGRFRCLDLRRGLDSSGGSSPGSSDAVDEGRYPLSALARALSKDYGPANERLLRGYLQLAFPGNDATCTKLLEEPLLNDPTLANASDEASIERHADAYLGKVSAELFGAEQRIRSILGIEPLGALPSVDCLAALFGPSR